MSYCSKRDIEESVRSVLARAVYKYTRGETGYSYSTVTHDEEFDGDYKFVIAANDPVRIELRLIRLSDGFPEGDLGSILCTLYTDEYYFAGLISVFDYIINTCETRS